MRTHKCNIIICEYSFVPSSLSAYHVSHFFRFIIEYIYVYISMCLYIYILPKTVSMCVQDIKC